MSCRGFFDMEHLPVQVIGYVLSLLHSAQDVIAASATCKKWREARLNHLHALCFNFALLPKLSAPQFEIISTKNVLQTKLLQSLSILMDLDTVFSPAAVIASISHSRDTLQNLYIDVGTSPTINGVGPFYMKFPGLKSLLLTRVGISLSDLSDLLGMCPKLEVLSLSDLNIGNSGAGAVMDLISASLKEIFVESIGLKNFKLGEFRLWAASIEKVHLRDCTLKHFKLDGIGKGTLKVVQFEDVCVHDLDISENTGSLEVVDVSYTKNPDVSNFTITWLEFYDLISRSSNLRKLRLWDIVFRNEDEVANLETISARFPWLTQLSLRYGLRDKRLDYGTQGSSRLQNVTLLEVGWTETCPLSINWVEGLLQRCPKLKKVVIYATFYDESDKECPIFSESTTSIFQLVREYTRVTVEFKFI